MTPARNERCCKIKVRALWDVSHALESHWCNCFCRVQEKTGNRRVSFQNEIISNRFEEMEVLNFVVLISKAEINTSSLPWLSSVQKKELFFLSAVRMRRFAPVLSLQSTWPGENKGQTRGRTVTALNKTLFLYTFHSFINLEKTFDSAKR